MTSSLRQASISSRSWLTVTTSVRCRTAAEFVASDDIASMVSSRPLNNTRVKEPGVRQLDACLLDCDQVSGQIAAIDCRDVLRQQRLKRFRVVPVEEVTVKLSSFATVAKVNS